MSIGSQGGVDSGESGQSTRVKVSLNLLQRDIDTVKQLAQERGVSNTEIIRNAIATEKFIHDAVSNGEKVLLEDEDGRLRQLVFR